VTQALPGQKWATGVLCGAMQAAELSEEVLEAHYALQLLPQDMVLASHLVYLDWHSYHQPQFLLLVYPHPLLTPLL